MRKFLPGFLFAFVFCISGFASFASAKPVYNPELVAGPEYNFRKATWGMSVEEVEASERKPSAGGGQLSSSDPEKTFIIYTGIKFLDIIPCQVGYAFNEGHLFSGQYFFVTSVDIYQNLIRSCEEHYGPYQKVLRRERDGLVRLVWDLGDTVLCITSYPNFDENGFYQYDLEFYDARQMHADLGVQISLQGYSPDFQAGPQYDFRKTRWLMTMDEVQKSEDAKITERSPLKKGNLIADYIAYPKREVLGHKATLGYMFQEDKLTISAYFYDSDKDIFSDLLEKYQEIFGLYDWSDESDGVAQYTWDLGKTILVFTGRKEGDWKYSSSAFFYYRMQLQKIPPEI